MVNSKSSTLKSVVVVGALALTATSALAGQVTLYEGSDFKGRSVIAIEAMPNLERSGFRGVAGSIIVGDGTWEVCTEAYFRGRCAQLIPGNYGDPRADLGSIASIRQTGSVTSPPARVVIHPDPQASTFLPMSTGRVVFFQYANFGGSSMIVENARVPDMDWTNFKFPPASMRVEAGSWLICPDIGYQGECQVFGPGEYPVLGTPLERGVASARQVWRPEYGSVDTYRYRR